MYEERGPWVTRHVDPVIHFCLPWQTFRCSVSDKEQAHPQSWDSRFSL